MYSRWQPPRLLPGRTRRTSQDRSLNWRLAAMLPRSPAAPPLPWMQTTNGAAAGRALLGHSMNRVNRSM